MSSPIINNTIKILPACFLALFLFYSMSLPFANTVYAEQKTINKKSGKEKPKNRGIHILVIGDSLTSGHGLKNESETYPNILEKVLRKFGYPVKVTNASIAGSTTSSGYARLLSHLNMKEKKYSLAIIVLGYNDALSKVSIQSTQIYIERVLEKLEERNIATVLIGLKAPSNMPKSYSSIFNSIYSKMSTQFNIPFYPNFLDGIAMRPKYTLADGIHPNLKGINLLVQKTSPIIMYAAFEVLNGRKPVKHPKRRK